jgi:hypothetical protein
LGLRLTDAEIAALIAERKALPADYLKRLQLKTTRGSEQRDVDVDGADGNRYKILLRQSRFNPLDFSAILGVYLQNGQVFRLRRYNGRSHEHTNEIEQDTFYDFHIHMATERYQLLDYGDEEVYAEVTNRYVDLRGATDCMLRDCGFVFPNSNQLTFWQEV